MTANFEDFGTYLKSAEYVNGLKVLIGTPAVPPRNHWPVDKKELANRHMEIAAMALAWASMNVGKACEVRGHKG